MRAVFLVIGLLVLAASGGASTTRDATAVCAWRSVPPAKPKGDFWSFSGVDVVRPGDVWAVGNHGYPRRTLVERWDGRRWRIVPSPSPRGNNYLHAVDGTGPNDVWAVGYRELATSSGEARTLILHWDGRRWSIVPSPSHSPRSQLYDVVALAADDVWAFGGDWGSPHVDGWSYLILHWDGRRWEFAPDSGRYEGILSHASFVSPHNGWAVGGSDVLHWDGVAWSLVEGPAPPFELFSVAALPSGVVWGGGGDEIRSGIFRWNGRRWARIAHPRVEGPGAQPLIRDIAAVSARDVWAVAVGARTKRLHWNGSRWHELRGPLVDGLYAVAAASGRDVWAVGSAIARRQDQGAVQRYSCR